MFIVAWDRENVVNVGNATHIGLEKNKIVAAMQTQEIMLGAYRSGERAKEVFSEMLSTMFIPNLILVNANFDQDELAEKFRDSSGIPWGLTISGDNTAIQPVAREIYYMPEE